MAVDPIQQLGQLYAEAARELKERAIQRLIRDKRKLTSEAMRARLLQAEVNAIISKLDEDSAQWIAENAPEIYADAIRQTNKRLVALGAGEVASLEMQPLIHQEALQVIVNSMQDKLGEASQEMARSLRNVVRSTQLRAVLDKEIKRQIGKGNIEGKARREVSDQVRERLLAEFGEKPFRVGGATFTAESYSSMVVRTMTREAATAGTVNRMVEIGEDLVQVTDSGATDGCAFYEGKVFSISGTSDKYEALSSIPNGGPPFHPNCTHGLVPFIEEFATERELRTAADVPSKALGKSFKEVNKLAVA